MIDWLSFGFGVGLGGLVCYVVGFWVGRSDRKPSGSS